MASLLEERPLHTPPVALKTRPRPGQYLDKLIMVALGCLTIVTRAWNLSNYPRWFSDEGVYVSQAWAVQNLGRLAPYTYWYDHPPVGWIQIAGWSALTGALRRHLQDPILAGRELMVVMATASVVLTYLLARRLHIRPVFAAVAGLLYIFSPLAVSFSRYVLLDNISIAWMLAAMVLALSPKQKLSAIAGSVLCLGVAILSKETSLLIAPAVLFLVWSNYRTANRAYAFWLFASFAVCFTFLYPLFAALKGELFPGVGHVSLWEGQIVYQLASRQTSGSIFDPHSDARLLIQNAWLGLDVWLPLLGVAALVPALLVPRLRGPVIALGIQVLWLFKGGYLPYPFIISLLPFMALLVAGVGDAWWPTMLRSNLPRRLVEKSRVGVAVVAVIGLAVSFLILIVPSWNRQLGTEFTAHETSDQQQAIMWVTAHLPHDARLITEGELWLSIRNSGFNSPEVIWTYKVDTDPAVKKDYGNVNGIDYLLLDQSTIDQSATTYKTVYDATVGARTLASFGTGSNRIVVLQVLKH